MMIDGNCYEYNKMRLASTWVLTDMNYLGKEVLEKVYIDSDYLFRFFMQSYRLDCRTNTKL